MSEPIVDRKSYYMRKEGEKLVLSETKPSDAECMEIVMLSHEGKAFNRIFIDDEKISYDRMIALMKAYTHQQPGILAAMGEEIDGLSTSEYIFSKRIKFLSTDAEDLKAAGIIPVQGILPDRTGTVDDLLNKISQMIADAINHGEAMKAYAAAHPVKPLPDADPHAYDGYPVGVNPGDLSKALKEQKEWSDQEEARRRAGPTQRGWQV